MQQVVVGKYVFSYDEGNKIRDWVAVGVLISFVFFVKKNYYENKNNIFENN